MTYLFMYRVTSDTGFAPCVENGLLSLTCCKGGKGNIRFWIGSGSIPSRNITFDYRKDNVYVLGLYQEKPKTNPNFLYLAKITEIQTMKEYFQKIGKNRNDGIYDYIEKEDKLIRNEKRHTDEKGRPDYVHLEDYVQKTDINGKYALLSNDYIYRGKDTVHLDIIDDYLLKYNFTNKSGRGARRIEGNDAERIVAECLKLRDNLEHRPHKPIKIQI